MYEEQRLLAAGDPFSEVLPMCNSMRREIALGRMTAEHPEKHTCKCGGSGNCQDCPNRNK